MVKGVDTVINGALKIKGCLRSRFVGQGDVVLHHALVVLGARDRRAAPLVPPHISALRRVVRVGAEIGRGEPGQHRESPISASTVWKERWDSHGASTCLQKLSQSGYYFLLKAQRAALAAPC